MQLISIYQLQKGFDPRTHLMIYRIADVRPRLAQVGGSARGTGGLGGGDLTGAPGQTSRAALGAAALTGSSGVGGGLA